MSEPKKTETPRKSRPSHEIHNFLQDAANRETLKAILRTPVFIAAMNYLEEESRRGVKCTQPVPSELIARQSAYHAGVSDVYDRLKALTQVRATPLVEDSWDHLGIEE